MQTKTNNEAIERYTTVTLESLWGEFRKNEKIPEELKNLLKIANETVENMESTPADKKLVNSYKRFTNRVKNQIGVLTSQQKIVH